MKNKIIGIGKNCKTVFVFGREKNGIFVRTFCFGQHLQYFGPTQKNFKNGGFSGNCCFCFVCCLFQDVPMLLVCVCCLFCFERIFLDYWHLVSCFLFVLVFLWSFVPKRNSPKRGNNK